MWETQVRSLGQEDPLEKEMATHSSTLAWKIPWTEEPGGLQSVGSQRVGHGKAGEAFHSWTQYLIPPSVPHKNFLPPRKSPSVGLLMSLRQLSFPFSLPLFCEKQPSLENSESIPALPKSAALSCSALWIRSLWWLQRWETHVRISEWVQCCLFSMELRLERVNCKSWPQGTKIQCNNQSWIAATVT